MTVFPPFPSLPSISLSFLQPGSLSLRTERYSDLTLPFELRLRPRFFLPVRLFTPETPNFPANGRGRWSSHSFGDAGWGWGTVCKSGWDSTEPQASGLIHILLNHKHRSGFPGKIWMSNRNTQNRCGFSTAEVGAVLRYTSLGYFSFKVFKKKFFFKRLDSCVLPRKRMLISLIANVCASLHPTFFKIIFFP